MTTEELYKAYLSCGCRVTTDSRSISGGEIFFALKGENFDGNDYALSALEKGASMAVVDRDGLPRREGIIKVSDSLRTLQELAVLHRSSVRGGKLPVLGLTGTNGKTTTKNLIREVLSRRYRVCATEGNLNNDIGVPLSLLRITPETQIAVIEMGANHPDDIARLVQVCRPDYGLITNVGRAHLLGFGSFEGVKRAKGELYRWLGEHEGSLLFLNEDDTDLREMARGLPCHIYGYGLEYQGAEMLPCTPESPYLRIRLDGELISTHLVGSYNAANVLAAIAVGDRLGVPRKDAIEAIGAFVPANSRSQLLRTARNTLIVDAYNANPTSMAAALDNFSALLAPHKTVMLGDMLELGADSPEEHSKIVRRLKGSGFKVYLVGEEFRKALDAEGIADGWQWSESSGALASELKARPLEGETILVKGSRGIEMEKALPEL